MPLFVCEKCLSVDNTATGHFWGRLRNFFSPELNGMALCSECTPTKYSDGSPNKEGGKWHNKFPKQHVDDHLKKHPNSELMNYNNKTKKLR